MKLIEANLFSELPSVQALSQWNLKIVAETLTQRIQAEITAGSIGNVGFDLAMLALQQSPVISALNTNVFQVSEPNSTEPKLITSFYPLHDGARFDNVSHPDAVISMDEACLTSYRFLCIEL